MKPDTRRIRVLVGGFLAALLAACAGVPKGITPVEGFDIGRYTGKWYEIARLDHPFERGLTRVTAEYTRTDSGGIRVVNRGFDPVAREWQQVEGRAVFTGSENTGSLKVSFFGPFYGGYHLIALDRENYEYALVAGSSRSYLWILARTPRLDAAIVERLVDKAERLGFDTGELIFVDQTH